MFSMARMSEKKNSRMVSNASTRATMGRRIFAPGMVVKSGAMNRITRMPMMRRNIFITNIVPKIVRRSSSSTFAASRIKIPLIPGSMKSVSTPASVMA